MAVSARPAPASVLDIRDAIEYADPETADLLREIATRKHRLDPEQQMFAALCDRFDNLYYPEIILEHAGASHWAGHPSAHTPGQSHVSLNVPPVYVDVPASLQSVPPIENMVALEDSEQGRMMAAMTERLYRAWVDEEHLDLLGHQACIVKGLYGRTAAKVFWDEDSQRPKVRLIDQPRNLYLGWGTSDYTRLDWALYTYRQSAEGVYEDWGLEVIETDKGGNVVPFVRSSSLSPNPANASEARWLAQQSMEIEVYDYWYRRAKGDRERTTDQYGHVDMETWNCIFVGNVLVKAEKHPEYAGRIPYLPLFNTYIPGMPSGRPELYDIESLLREKDERLTAGSQMLSKTLDGQLWQLVGPEAPDAVPSQAIPRPNKVSAPGPGNRIENISPWMPEFQVEQYLSRLDRELADVSGLNDLLRGLAPATVLSSSKAITALVANYEARIRIKRELFYRWREDVWALASQIWADKVPIIAPLLQDVARLQTEAPSLTPRDDIETGAMAANMVTNKLWSQKRGMDKVGVDDPEAESDTIRAERTDASMYPADVQVMAQLMTVLQSLGYGAPEQAQQQADQQAQSLDNYRQLFGGQQGAPSMNGPGEGPAMPPEGAPANTPEGQQLTPPGELPPGELQAQTLVQEGEASNRLVSTQEIPTGG